MVGLRSFNFGSQYWSENVTSDSDTCPSASHALIICASKLILWKNSQQKRVYRNSHNARTLLLKIFRYNPTFTTYNESACNGSTELAPFAITDDPLFLIN